jgi:hypothetical protein
MLDTSKSTAEIPGKFGNVVLEKNGEDREGRSCKKRIRVTRCQAGEEYPADNKKKEG